MAFRVLSNIYCTRQVWLPNLLPAHFSILSKSPIITFHKPKNTPHMISASVLHLTAPLHNRLHTWLCSPHSLNYTSVTSRNSTKLLFLPHSAWSTYRSWIDTTAMAPFSTANDQWSASSLFFLRKCGSARSSLPTLIQTYLFVIWLLL